MENEKIYPSDIGEEILIALDRIELKLMKKKLEARNGEEEYPITYSN